MARATCPVMILVAERKLADLIRPPTPGGVLEASGVVAKGADYYVIFDNVRRIARIHRSLEPGSKQHSWFGWKRDGEGYEDIAFSLYTRRFYLLIEAEKHPDGTYKALVDECDESAQYKRRRWIDLAFEKRNRGFEGLSAVRWREQDYLLALCEANRCRAGRAGRKPGGGRIHLLQRSRTLWKPVARSSCHAPSDSKTTRRSRCEGAASRSSRSNPRGFGLARFASAIGRLPARDKRTSFRERGKARSSTGRSRGAAG
jgi:hypothetical protein